MTKPRLLDLFCGAGGAARGYQQAGFHVTGVDIIPQPRYAGDRFIQADALDMLDLLGENYDAIHASPPCLPHTQLTKQSGYYHEDFVPRTRFRLDALGKLYVIENVEGAPLLDPVTLCGANFPELRVYRHRLFETNWPLRGFPFCRHREMTWTTDKRKKHGGQPLDLAKMRVQVTGGGNAPQWAKRQAMGIDWMVNHEINQAIPPAYTHHVGRQLLDALWLSGQVA